MQALFSIAWIFAATTADPCALHFTEGWVPQAPPVAPMWAAYGVLRNDADRPLTITALSSGDFAMAQIHETREEAGVERMRRIDPLIVPAHGEVRLARGSKHIMLMRPTHDLGKAQSVAVEFRVDGCAAPVAVTLPIRSD